MENYESVMEQLRQYTADELFYKEYYEAQSSPEKLQEFLVRQSKEEVVRRRLIIPEIYPKDRSLLSEQLFFASENSRNIWIKKHDRYAPAFKHRHEYFEIIFVLSGSCTHRIGERETVLEKGDLCFVAPYVEHSTAVFDDSVVLLLMLQRTTFNDTFFDVLRSQNILSDFFLSNLLTRSKVTDLDFRLDEQDDRELIELLLSMVQEENEEDAFTYRILNNMMSLFFAKLMRKYGRTAVTHSSGEEKSEQGVDIVRYINDNYKSVTLTQVADKFGYSIEHCSRLIKSVAGQNFTGLLRSIRMRRAETLLVTTPSSIENISAMVGYENPTTFIKLFKQQHRMTPGSFRRSFAGRA